mgnify:CR=1 FL=1|jgi:hypothetical protein
MATQITQVYAKRKNDASWTRIDKLYEDGSLIFQESPVRDGYYDYTTVILTNISYYQGYYNVRNDTGREVDVMFDNNVIVTFPAGQLNIYPAGIYPAFAQIGGLGFTRLTSDGLPPTWTASVKSDYHPPVYTRNLYVN